MDGNGGITHGAGTSGVSVSKTQLTEHVTNLAVTPFGGFCLHCNEPVCLSEDNLRLHTKSKSRQPHPLFGHGKWKAVSISTRTEMDRLAHPLQRAKFLTDIKEKRYACSCGANFPLGRLNNAKRHLGSKKCGLSDCSVSVEDMKLCIYVKTICNRWIKSSSVSSEGES